MILVYTGNGKGKTSAALGTAFRAIGYGHKVCIVQFMKGTWKYGELYTADRLKDSIDLVAMGKGFYKILDDSATEDEHKEAALKAMEYAKERAESGEIQLLILDEVLVAISTGILKEKTLLDLIESVTDNLHLVLTGRDATQRIIDIADLVTEMKEIKHPFTKGKLAVKGIDY